MRYPVRFIAALLMLFMVAFAQQVRAQQPTPGQSPSALNPQLMTDIHVPLLAVIDVLQRKQELADALSQWEAASQYAVPLTPEDEHIAYMLHKAKRTGHEIAVAIALQSRIRVDELNQRFNWKSIDRTGNRIVLTAEPRETVEQLFYHGFELQLDADTHLPVSIRFFDRNGKPAAESMELAVKIRPPEQPDVLLASAEVAADKPRSREPLRLTELPQAEPQESTAVRAEIPTDTPPEVEALLNEWASASAEHRTLSAEFVRRTYDSVFIVEKTAIGRLYYESPDKGRVDIIEPELKPKISVRRDASGNPYKLEADRPESWIWTGKFVIRINEPEKFVEYLRTSEIVNRGGSGLVLAKPQWVFPLVLDIRPVEMIQNCQLTIGRRDKFGVWLEGKPRPGTRLANQFSAATVIIEPETHLVKFARYVDPSGNIETVYSFENWQINKPQVGNPLKPNLTGYNGMLPVEVDESEPVQAPKP